MRTLIENPLVRQMVGKPPEQIIKRLRRALVLFLSTLALFSVTILLLVTVANGIDDITLIWLSSLIVFIVGLYIAVVLFSGLYPLFLALYCTLDIKRQLRRFDWDSLLKLTPISKQDRVAALLFASNFNQITLAALMLALPISAAIVRVLLAQEIIFDPPPLTVLVVRAAFFAVMLPAIHLLAAMLALVSAVSFDETWLTSLIALGATFMTMLVLLVGTFTGSMAVAIGFSMVAYLALYAVYRLALRAI